MTENTHLASYRSRSAPQCRLARIVALTGAIAGLALQAACGGGGDKGIIEVPDVDTTTLVGTWEGTVDGDGSSTSYGYSRTTTILRADSTTSVTAENPLYCAANGTWSVAGTQYTSRLTDCGGTIITAVAPFNKRRLTGTWSATSGRKGTFTSAKQP